MTFSSAIKENIANSENEVASLKQQIERVSGVAAQIKAVTKQTNLLALNATIEAARAGESGKGFAVVAGEVKILAEQTSIATEEIAEILHTLHLHAGNLETNITQMADQSKHLISDDDASAAVDQGLSDFDNISDYQPDEFDSAGSEFGEADLNSVSNEDNAEEASDGAFENEEIADQGGDDLSSEPDKVSRPVRIKDISILDGITDNQKRLVNESFVIVNERADRASDLFLERLFETAPDMRSIFPDDLSDVKKQMMTALVVIVGHLDNDAQFVSKLEEIGKALGEYEVTDENFVDFADALTYTLEKILVTSFTDEIRAAWTAFYSVVASLMIEA